MNGKWISIIIIGIFMSIAISSFAPDANALRIKNCVSRNSEWLTMEYSNYGCKFKNFGIKGEGK